jgi:hypothetical protein
MEENMARKTTQGSRTGRARKSTARSADTTSQLSKKFDLKKINSRDAKRLMNKVTNNPVALYIAGGVGALFAARFAMKYYKNHPGIKDFIKENFDTVENTLKEYRHGIEESEGGEARH